MGIRARAEDTAERTRGGGKRAGGRSARGRGAGRGRCETGRRGATRARARSGGGLRHRGGAAAGRLGRGRTRGGGGEARRRNAERREPRANAARSGLARGGARDPRPVHDRLPDVVPHHADPPRPVRRELGRYALFEDVDASLRLLDSHCLVAALDARPPPQGPRPPRCRAGARGHARAEPRLRARQAPTARPAAGGGGLPVHALRRWPATAWGCSRFTGRERAERRAGGLCRRHDPRSSPRSTRAS